MAIDPDDNELPLRRLSSMARSESKVKVDPMSPLDNSVSQKTSGDLFE